MFVHFLFIFILIICCIIVTRCGGPGGTEAYSIQFNLVPDRISYSIIRHTILKIDDAT